MSKTVMIVEDNELNMKLFHDLLEAHGYHPIGTRNGIEALDFARKHRPDQNWVSRALLGLDEDQRNETFTYLLRDSNAKCDRVIRTLFNGSTVELDDWEVLCRDRNSYSLTITPEQTAGIELVSCHELLATSKMLLEGAGSKNKATGCRIKRAERLHRR